MGTATFTNTNSKTIEQAAKRAGIPIELCNNKYGYSKEAIRIFEEKHEIHKFITITVTGSKSMLMRLIGSLADDGDDSLISFVGI
jgi:hypothetical protein